MSLSGDWRERHPRRRSGGRVFFYIVLLAVTVLLMLKAGDISSGFTGIFLQQPAGEPE